MQSCTSFIKTVQLIISRNLYFSTHISLSSLIQYQGNQEGKSSILNTDVMKLPSTSSITAVWPGHSTLSDKYPYLDIYQRYSIEVPSLGLYIEMLLSVQFYHDKLRQKHCQQKVQTVSPSQALCFGLWRSTSYFSY